MLGGPVCRTYLEPYAVRIRDKRIALNRQTFNPRAALVFIPQQLNHGQSIRDEILLNLRSESSYPPLQGDNKTPMHTKRPINTVLKRP
jgi:hypothetical protein